MHKINLKTASYQSQVLQWPSSGQQILAQFDEKSIVVYQAYRPAIGIYAATHGTFGGEFSFSRMSWIKPNFLWMMYRCGWATKPEQEMVLAITIKRQGFEEILKQAVPSTYHPEIYPNQPAWQQAVKQSDVRLQWDPDHDPMGKPLERRAIQLGLRGQALLQYAKEWIVNIEDITSFVVEQRVHAQNAAFDKLLIPQEEIYPIHHQNLIKTLGIKKP